MINTHSKEPRASQEKPENLMEILNQASNKKWYNEWWIGRLVLAVIVGLILAAVLPTPLGFVKTFLASSTLLVLWLLSRNPKYRFTRIGLYILGILASINFFPQIDFFLNISEHFPDGGSADKVFKLVSEDQELISVALVGLAGFLFYLDFRQNQ